MSDTELRTRRRNPDASSLRRILESSYPKLKADPKSQSPKIIVK
jgi:hypothetical protein